MERIQNGIGTVKTPGLQPGAATGKYVPALALIYAEYFGL
jgi:hypothetical protein